MDQLHWQPELHKRRMARSADNTGRATRRPDLHGRRRLRMGHGRLRRPELLSSDMANPHVEGRAARQVYQLPPHGSPAGPRSRRSTRLWALWAGCSRTMRLDCLALIRTRTLATRRRYPHRAYPPTSPGRIDLWYTEHTDQSRSRGTLSRYPAISQMQHYRNANFKCRDQQVHGITFELLEEIVAAASRHEIDVARMLTALTAAYTLAFYAMLRPTEYMWLSRVKIPLRVTL